MTHTSAIKKTLNCSETSHHNTMTDHQLAHSTAEKIAIAYIVPPDKAQDWEDIRTNLTQIILAHDHERDRAATAMGGETPRTDAEAEWTDIPNAFEAVGADFARSLERELNVTRESWRQSEKAEDNLRRALTALQESNREVVAENAVLKRANSIYVREGLQSAGIILDLRARLAVADEMAKALERVVYVVNSAGVSHLATGVQIGEISWFHKMTDAMKDAEDSLSRWTAPQAGTQPMANETVFFKDMDEAMAFHKKLHEPASPAIPITPETIMSFPGWLLHQLGPTWQHWMSRPTNLKQFLLYHPDQPTAPTFRPTATEGGV